MPTQPYCGHCGYALVGLTESSKCPECGRPLVDVLTRDPGPIYAGKRYTSPIRVFGLPLVQVALGPRENEKIGVARAIIAIGDVAIGWLALGRFTLGLISFGALSAGVISIGGVAAGVLSLGGLSLGGLGVGGASIGLLALGGAAVGYAAMGGAAVGWYAQGGAAAGRHTMDFLRKDPLAIAFFDRWSWLIGTPNAGALWTPVIWVLTFGLIFAAALFLVVALGHLVRGRDRPPGDQGQSTASGT